MPNVMQVKLAQQASFLDALKSSSPAEKAQIARQNSGFRKYALRRLTKIFHLPENSLRLSDRFGEELKSTFVSNLKNEFDLVLDDIKDAATKEAPSTPAKFPI